MLRKLISYGYDASILVEYFQQGNKKKFILNFSFNWKFFQKILLQKETILQLKFILVIIEAFF